MNGRKAKLRRREEVFKPKQFFKPLTIEIDGKEVYMPRKQRRLIMRRFMTDLRKGRIDLDALQKKREERIKLTDDRAK